MNMIYLTLDLYDFNATVGPVLFEILRERVSSAAYNEHSGFFVSFAKGVGKTCIYMRIEVLQLCDVVHVNLAGRSQAFLSIAGGAGFLKVKLPNQVSSIAATVEVTLSDGTTLTKPFVSGEGLLSDPSHILIFGLAAQQAKSVTVTFIDGSRQTRTGTWRKDTVVF